MTEPTSAGSPQEPQTTSDTSHAGQLSKFYNPCEAFRVLTERRAKLVAGEALAEYEYHGNGTERRLKYSIGSIEALDRDIREAQKECAAQLGIANPGRRFALTAGSRFRYEPAQRWSARLGYY